MLQPIFGDIRIEPRIVDNRWKVQHEYEPQCQSCQARGKKEPSILPHQFQHGENIARLKPSSGWESASHSLILPALVIHVPPRIDHVSPAAYDERLTLHGRTCFLRSATRPLAASETFRRRRGR